MAENKKSFILYADQLASFEILDDAEAGRLIKHILRYINDLNPEFEDKLTKIAFEPIKQQLKRDLNKWESIREKRRGAGKASAESRQNQQKPTHVENNQQKPTHVENNQQKPTHVDFVEKNSTNPTVTVNDNVTVNVNVKKENIIPKIKDVAIPKIEIAGYLLCVDFWLKEFKPNFIFKGQQGKALKSIINSVTKLLMGQGKEITNESVCNIFKFMCLNLPDWYKDKDLPVLDQKFNEIILQIKNKNNGINQPKETVREAASVYSSYGKGD